MFLAVMRAELVRAARRGRAHVLVWLFAGWLILQLLHLYGQHLGPYGARDSFAEAGAFARSFIDLVLGQQFVLLALVTPAFAAGAIAEEKVRGTLQYILIAGMTSADIVLGKLIARAVQVGVLALTPLPLVALVGPYAGLTPEFLIIWLVVCTLLVAGICAASVLASVWAKQTRDAVLLAYLMLGGLWLLRVYALLGGLVEYNVPASVAYWLEAFDPMLPLGPALDRTDPAEAFRRLGAFTVAWGTLGLCCTALAVWRLRPAYLRQLEARPGRLTATSMDERPTRDEAESVGITRTPPSRSSPGDDPLAWKESRAARRLTSPRAVLLAIVLTVILTAAASGSLFGSETLAVVGWALVVLTVIGVRASGSICGERERQTWDALLMTPLTEREILSGKLNGIILGAWPFILVVALIAMVSALAADTVTSVVTAVAIAFWIPLIALMTYFIGAVGLYCSARSQNSWRSLIAALAVGYAGGLVIFGVGSMAGGCCFGSMFTLLSNVGGAILGGVLWLATVGYFYWLAARVFLNEAVRRIALQDRTRPRHLLDAPYLPLDPVDGQRL